MKRKVLIVGSNSYSGASTAKVLLKNNYEVFGVSRSSQVPECYRPYREFESNFHFFCLGSNFEPSKLVEICKSENIGVILNFSAQSMVSQSWEAPMDWYETNCVWLSELVSALSAWKRLERFIQFSTPEVYGSTDTWSKESTQFNPSTPYAISRAAGDMHLLAMSKVKNFPVILTRASNVYGPGQPRYRLIPKLIMSVLSGTKMDLHGGGKSSRSFIYGNDVGNAVMRVTKEGKVGETYHISTLEAHRIIDIVRMITDFMQVNLTDAVNIVGELPGKDEAYLLDSKKIRDDLGWEEKTLLNEGIANTVKWAEDNFRQLLDQQDQYQHRS